MKPKRILLLAAAGLATLFVAPIASAANADLSIPVHSHSPVGPQVGASVDYFFTIHNGGATDVANNITVTVSITGSQQYTGSASPYPFSDNGNGTFTANMGSLGAGSDKQFRIGFQINATGSISATATVSSPDDPDSTNNQAIENDSVVQKVTTDLEIVSVTVSPNPAETGDLRRYHGVVRNNGPDDAVGISVGIQGDSQNSSGSGFDFYETLTASAPTDAPLGQSGIRFMQLGDIPVNGTAEFDVFYTAAHTGSFSRNFFLGITDQETDPNLNNNHRSVASTIDANGTPGLAATLFTVDDHTGPTVGVSDSVLRFAAYQNASVAGISAQVQTTTTPDNESSWTNMPNGAGLMSLDVSTSPNRFILHSTSYPLVSGVYFRAVCQAHGFDNSISNVVGPFDLTSHKPHLTAPVFSLRRNGTFADFYFRAAMASAPSGIALRIQSSTTPGDEMSWTDLADGTSGAMKVRNVEKQYYLLVNQLPAAAGLYFRVVAAAAGYVDAISRPRGSYTIVPVTPPTMKVSTTVQLSGSGDGKTLDTPILVPGSFTIHVTAQTSRSITRIELQIDGRSRFSLTDGSKTLQYTIGGLSFGHHIVEAFAIDDQGVRARAGTAPIYVEVVSSSTSVAAKPPGIRTTVEVTAPSSDPRVFRAVASGDWSIPANWKDINGNPGVPGPNDTAIIPNRQVMTLSQPTVVNALTLNGAILQPVSQDLTILGTMTVGDFGSFNSGHLIINSGATCQFTNLAIFSETVVDNYGQFILRGNDLLGLSAFNNYGVTDFHLPLQIASNVGYDVSEDVHAIETKAAMNRGILIGFNPDALIGQDGNNLISQDGNNVVSNDGGTFVNPLGGSIISQDGNSLLSERGAGIIGDAGASLLSDAGGNFIKTGSGASLASRNATSPSDATTSSPGSGYVQEAGNTDLSVASIIGHVTLNGGVLSGSGVIAGDLTNNGGYIVPGHSPGFIFVNGNFSQAAQGTTVLEQGGVAGNQFDQLLVAGTAALGGHLDVKTIDGYVPSSTGLYSPLGFGSVTGSFATVSANAALTKKNDGLLVVVDPNQSQPVAGRPLNIATRLQIQSGDSALIAGFIVTGPAGSTKKVLIRAIGPSLANFGVPGTISDPLLELHKPDNSVVSNDDWQQGDASQIPNGFAPSDPRESVIVATLSPGNYSAVLKGAHGETGVGLAEVYDLDSTSTAQLANISTRGFVNTGDNVMIGGFIVGGSEPAKVLVRAIGPSLTQFGVQGALPATTLELHDANGAVISNEGWRNTQEADIKATTIPPSNDNEAAILATLVPGNYTAVVRGRNNTTGIGLVEAYNLQ